MTIKSTVTQTIILVNGKKYHSMDELPPEIRTACEEALAGGKGHVTLAPIVVNGKQYANLDFIPEDLRPIVRDPMGEPKQSSTWTPVTFAIALLIVLAYYYLRSR